MTIALTFSEKGKFKHNDVYNAPKDQYIASARFVFNQEVKVTSRISPARFNPSKPKIEPENDTTSLLHGSRSGSSAQNDLYPGTVRIHIQGLSNGICCFGASRAEGSLLVELKNRPRLNVSENNEVKESSGGGIDVQRDLKQNPRGHAVVAGGNVTIVHNSELESRHLEIMRGEFLGGLYCGFQLGRYEFLWDNYSVAGQEALRSIKRQISDYLKQDNLSPIFTDFRTLFGNICSLYLSNGKLYHKYCAVHLGLCFQRFTGVYKVCLQNKKAQSQLDEAEHLAFSAIGDIDASIISDKKKFFAEMKEANLEDNLADFLRFLDSSKYFLMFKSSESIG